MPIVAPATTAHDHGNGKDHGKAKGKNKDDVEVTPVAETLAPADPAVTVVAPPATPEVPVVVPAVAPADDKHGRGHGKDK